MENNELITKNQELVENRQEQIELFTELLLSLADGENIVGDGENLVYEAPSLKLTHEFVDGIYIRRMDLEKGSMVIGAVHKHLHVWFLMEGHVTIAKKEGTEDYLAPCYVIASPGTQRLIQANEDSIFINVHKNPTDTRDIKKIEEEFCCINMAKYKEYLKTQK